jgi:hypothetical protein
MPHISGTEPLCLFSSHSYSSILVLLKCLGLDDQLYLSLLGMSVGSKPCTLSVPGQPSWPLVALAGQLNCHSKVPKASADGVWIPQTHHEADRTYGLRLPVLLTLTAQKPSQEPLRAAAWRVSLCTGQHQGSTLAAVTSRGCVSAHVIWVSLSPHTRGVASTVHLLHCHSAFCYYN